MAALFIHSDLIVVALWHRKAITIPGNTRLAGTRETLFLPVSRALISLKMMRMFISVTRCYLMQPGRLTFRVSAVSPTTLTVIRWLILNFTISNRSIHSFEPHFVILSSVLDGNT